MSNKQANNDSTLSAKNDVEQMELWYTVSANAKQCNYPGNFLKAHTRQPISPLLGIYSSEIRTYIHTQNRTWMFIDTLFIKSSKLERIRFEKDNTKETENWPMADRDQEWGEGLTTIKHEDIFSGGATVSVKFDSHNRYITVWVCQKGVHLKGWILLCVNHISITNKYNKTKKGNQRLRVSWLYLVIVDNSCC